MQQRMAEAELHAILLTSAADILYFSGFSTQFWQSPTRPWFLAIPSCGAPVAVIPEIGKSAMSQTWIDDIRCWPSPRPDDEGVSLLAELLREWGGTSGKVGMMLGAGSSLRMPVSDYHALQEAIAPLQIANCSQLVQSQRMIKSSAEIDKIRSAAQAAFAGFSALPDMSRPGMSLRELCRQLQVSVLQNGADEVPYLSASSGIDGSDCIILSPSGSVPASGETVIIDMGAVFDGYFCDINRNFAVGKPSDLVMRGHTLLQNALQAGVEAARPGATAADVWQAMQNIIVAEGEGITDGSITSGGATGRMGHGVGLQLTEPPSFTPDDRTVLSAGMVLAVEPCITLKGGGQLVCEENIALGENGAEYLSVCAGNDLPVLK